MSGSKTTATKAAIGMLKEMGEVNLSQGHTIARLMRENERLRFALTWIAENGPPKAYEDKAREALS